MQGFDPDLFTRNSLPEECKDVVKRYMAFVEQAIPKIGLHLAVQRDFAQLVELAREHADEGYALSPAYDRTLSDVGEWNAFWIRAVDGQGRVAAIAAARLYDIPDSLGNEFRTSRFFYTRPPEEAPYDGISLDAPRAEAWTGKVVYSGGVWVRPDHRRRGFTRIVPRLCRAIAAVRWNPPRYLTFVTPENDRHGVTRAYGSWVAEGRMVICWSSWRAAREWLLFSMTPGVLISDLEQSMAAQAGSRELEPERLESNRQETIPAGRASLGVADSDSFLASSGLRDRPRA